MPDVVNCPACGAANPSGSEWCGQCFAGFAVASSPPRPAEPPTTRPVQSHPGPVRSSAPPAGSKGPGGPPTPPTRSDFPGPASPTPPVEGPQADLGGGWNCASCGTANPVSSDICRSCNTSIYETFGADENDRVEIDPTTAAVWGLLPGGGHFKVGQAGLGLAVAGLLVTALVFGALMMGGNRSAVGIVLLLVSGVAWAISIYDATRFAAHNEDAVLLRPKVITMAMGLVFAVVIVAAVSITGEGTTP